MGVTAPARAVVDEQEAPPSAGRAGGSAAVRLAMAVFAAVVVAQYASTLWRTGGTFTYPLDDPAIHLSVARRLAYDGTWGVVAGEYQAASSSPLWTLVLAPTQWIARGALGELVPLVLNTVAGLGVLHFLRRELSVLRPSRRCPLDVAAVAGVVVVLLFLPGLAFVGMEHTLHVLLVLASAMAVEARWASPGGAGAGAHRPPAWVPFGLMVLATATRFESVALVAAFAVALVGADLFRSPAPPGVPAPRRSRMLAVAGLAVAAAGTVAVSAAVNLAFGQEPLPNSVVLKTVGDRGDTRRSVDAFVERLVSDRLLVAFVVLAVVALVLARRQATRGRADGTPAVAPAVFPALVTLVTAAAQVEFGGAQDLRYLGFVYGLGTWTLLRALPAFHGIVARRWPRLPASALVLALVPIALVQIRVTVGHSGHATKTWEQRHHVARFLADAYHDDDIAIGELGYIALYHDGPLTDVYGLADHEVLEARMDGTADARFWRDLQQRRDVRVAVTYSFTLGDDVPDEWIHVADWHSDYLFPVTRFWATEPEEVEALDQQLRAFEPRLPDQVEVGYNELAGYMAAVRMDEERSAAG